MLLFRGPRSDNQLARGHSISAYRPFYKCDPHLCVLLPLLKVSMDIAYYWGSFVPFHFTFLLCDVTKMCCYSLVLN